MTAARVASRVTLCTWLAFLFGSRQAIQTIASSQQALWVGLLFVFAAGFAREYDGAYLPREPWHYILPLAASLATSSLLYMLIYCGSRLHGLTELRWWAGYRTMLTFFWFTAPLAWLYVIPVERFMEPGPATRANLMFLAVVSLWRVLLITRALSVWLGANFFAMLWIVLFFADTVALVLATVTPTPIWNIMGGVRTPERELVIIGAKHLVWFVGGTLWFVLTIGASAVLFWTKSRWELEAPSEFASARVGGSLWCMAGILAVVGVGLLPIAQVEQAHRWQAERLLHAEKHVEAVQYIADRSRGDFPPHWDPPPRTAYGERVPEVMSIFAAMQQVDTPPWLYEVYLEKQLARHDGIVEAIEAAKAGNAAVLIDLIDFLEKHPPRGEFAFSVERQLSDALNELERGSWARERVKKYLDRSRKPAGD